MKINKKKIIVATVIVLLIGGSGSQSSDQTKKGSISQEAHQTNDGVSQQTFFSDDTASQKTIIKNEKTKDNGQSELSTPQQVSTNDIATISDEAKDKKNKKKKKKVSHRTGKKIVGISDKNINDTNLHFRGKVINDKTDNWRYAVISENINIIEYALSYYKEYYEDGQTHGIINYSQNVTASLNVYNDIIYLSLLEHIEYEEFDAVELFSGDLLAEYMIYTDNGDIKKIQ